MAHGTPDWGLVGPKSTTYGLDDVGEAAVRLGSPVIWDRRGDVVWMETWRNGLRGAQVGGVAFAWSYQLMPIYAENGPFALYMRAGGLPNGEIHAAWYHPVFVNSGWGWEVWFSFLTTANNFQFALIRYDGTNAHVGRVRYNVQDDTLAVQTTGAAWEVQDGTYPLYNMLDTHHVIKLVADHDNDEYHWLILDNHYISLRGIPLFVVGSGTPPSSGAEVYMRNDLALYAECTIDTLIITQNEPIQP